MMVQLDLGAVGNDLPENIFGLGGSLSLWHCPLLVWVQLCIWVLPNGVSEQPHIETRIIELGKPHI